MLKKILPVFGLLVLGAAWMSGCTDPIGANQDPINVYPQVHVESYWLRNVALVVQRPLVSRVGAGQLKVVIPVRNKTDGDLQLDYIYYFTDSTGRQSEATSSRLFVDVPRKGIQQIEFTSLSASAADFRVELFGAK